MAEVETSETLSERQENEFEALQSIFGISNVIDLRENDAWKIYRPPEMKISLRPPESMNGQESYVSLDLFAKYPQTYPEVVPELELINAKGLSNHLLLSLKQELIKKAKTLCGEVMMLELCQHVQDFLHAHNKPPFKSFYEEMMSNKQKEQERIAQAQQKKMDIQKKKKEKQQLQIEEEIRKRQKALREETQRIRNETKQTDQNRNSVLEPPVPMSDAMVSPIAKDSEQRARSVSKVTAERQHTPMHQIFIADSGSYQKTERRRRTSTPRCGEEQENTEPQECTNHRGTHNITFNHKKKQFICRGRCLGHSTRGSTAYIGLDTQEGELVAISEWVLRWRHPSRKLKLDDKTQDEEISNKYLKQLAAIEQELHSLVKLKHSHLVKYHAMQCTKDVGKITVHVLMDYIGGGSLTTYLHDLKLPLELLRQYAQQILEGLCYLHSKSVVHKELKATSILLDSKGNIRITDYSLNKRLEELYCLVESSRAGVHFADEKPPSAPSGGKTGKKGDIYRLGILLLSLAEGQNLIQEIPNIPRSYHPEFKDFLEKCVISNESQRWSASQLLDHTYLKTPLYIKVGHKETSSCPRNNNQNDGRDNEEEEDTDIPYIPTSDSGHSRLKSEFDILKWLGKGGFGDVIKVRNKLDGRFYAIKRIPLNTKSKQFTKKITREVKLLSRLNHENVVRYYNSWIETSEEFAPSDSSATCTQSFSESYINCSKEERESVVLRNSLDLADDIEMNVPAAIENSLEWSISLSNRGPELEEACSSDEDEDDEEDEDGNDVFGASFLPYDDSEEGIVFEQKSKFVEWPEILGDNDKEEDEPNQRIESDLSNKSSTMEARPKLQFLYIQMEFCEKSTLRSCIDMDLHIDLDRAGRFFREILEGLVHIHEQGMIHRDLKPVNIFLDSNDHVKIGDFGLATTDIISKQQTSLLDLKYNLDKSASMDLNVHQSQSKSVSLENSELTGKVGSALYVSPEMLITSTRAHYNQKVDIYSIGIIFFEMCYRPLKTGMERVKILSNLRLPAIEFPADFDEVELSNQAEIMRWTLNHDPNKRPTAQELLQSELLPPPHMEEAELTEVLRSTIADSNSRSYRHLVNTILSQPLNQATDFTFDMDLHKGTFHHKPALIQMQVIDTLEQIFRKHGGMHVSTPLLMPKSTIYDYTDQYVCLMDHSGGLVALPFDLRIPLARYIARNNIQHLKRYNIERVYRQKKLYGLHPRELTECAFDIITNTPTSGLSEAELLQIINEILEEYPILKSRNYYVRMNHVSLLKALLLHCGVPDELHQHVLAIFGDSKLEKQGRLQLQTKLCSLSLSDQTIINLYHFIETEGCFGKIAGMLRCITKGRGQAAALAKKALQDLKEIISHLEDIGCKLEVTLALGMVYNIHMSTGVIFQVVANIKRKKKQIMDVIAAGGRYDSMIGAFQRTNIIGNQQSVQPVAAGISISLDKLVATISEDPELPDLGVCEVLVCSLGNNPIMKDKLQVAKALWSAGICTDIFQDMTQSQEEIQNYCRKMGIPHLVILKDLESDTIKVRSIEKDGKVTEKKISSACGFSLVADHIKQSLQQAKTELTEQGANSGSKAPSVTSTFSSETVISSVSNHPPASNVPSYNVTFIQPDNSKLASNIKRRYESQIYANISSALKHISSKAKVEVIGLDFNGAVIKSIAAFLEVDGDEAAFESSISTIVEKHTRHKKYFVKVFDHIHDLKFDKKCSVILLYGLKDDSYRALL